MNTNHEPVSVLQIVRSILEEITLHPEQIKITESALGRTTTIKVQVHRGDMSRVLGSRATHFNALETIVSLIARRQGEQIKVRLIEPEFGEKDSYGKFEGQTVWNSANAVRVAAEICDAVLEHPSTVEVHDGEEFESLIDVTVEPREKRELTEMLMNAMQPLFNAIGKANGRLLSVNIAPKKH